MSLINKKQKDSNSYIIDNSNIIIPEYNDIGIIGSITTNEEKTKIDILKNRIKSLKVLKSDLSSFSIDRCVKTIRESKDITITKDLLENWFLVNYKHMKNSKIKINFNLSFMLLVCILKILYNSNNQYHHEVGLRSFQYLNYLISDKILLSCSGSIKNNLRIGNKYELEEFFGEFDHNSIDNEAINTEEFKYISNYKSNKGASIMNKAEYIKNCMVYIKNNHYIKEYSFDCNNKVLCDISKQIIVDLEMLIKNK